MASTRRATPHGAITTWCWVPAVRGAGPGWRGRGATIRIDRRTGWGGLGRRLTGSASRAPVAVCRSADDGEIKRALVPPRPFPRPSPSSSPGPRRRGAAHCDAGCFACDPLRPLTRARARGRRHRYRKLALKYHPDRETADPEAFVRVAEAYDVLSQRE